MRATSNCGSNPTNMMKKTVNVSVVGSTGSGKTAVIQVIAKALREAKFEHFIDWGQQGVPFNDDSFEQKRINAAANKSRVIVSEFPAPVLRKYGDGPKDLEVVVDYTPGVGYSTSIIIMGVRLRANFGDQPYSQERARSIAARMAAELAVDVEDKTRNHHDWVQPQ